MKLANKILISFRHCFARQATHTWFVIATLTFILRKEKYGVTDSIRCFGLPEKCYECVLHFYKADSWNLDQLINNWSKIIFEQDEVYRIAGKCALLVDGIKVSKEGQYMPASKKLHQESGNSNKGEYIFGHMHGVVGLAVGNDEKLFSVPISSRIHDGMNTILGWQQEGTEDTDQEQITKDKKKIELPKHPSKMIKEAHDALMVSDEDEAFCVGDRYFHGRPVLQTLNELNEKSKKKLILVTRARSTAVAYEDPPPRIKGTRGRPKEKGDTVQLNRLFDTRAKEFITATVDMYGKKQEVKYLVVELLWGKNCKKMGFVSQKLRFVLVKYKGTRTILVCTDLTVDALSIIKAYSIRFKIECSFKYLKHDIGAFDYHFWSSSTPRLNRYSKKEDPDPLEDITSERAKQNIIKTIKAYEMYMLCGCIALGILQLNSLQLHNEVGPQKFGYKRTHSSGYASEATMKNILGDAIIEVLIRGEKIPIINLISAKIKGKKREYDTFELDVA